MSESPHRRQGHRTAGVRARQVPAEAHEGTPAEFLRRHELESREALRDRNRWQQLLPRLRSRIADPRNLKLALDHLAGNGDRRVRSLDQDERWQLCRVVGSAILDGTFRLGCGTKRKIAKSSGRGTRTLTIPDYVDRMVERAVVQIIQPILNPLFLDTSLGYRPGKGRTDALVLAESSARKRDRWIWIAEDLANAFDMVPQRRLLDVVRHYLSDDEIVGLFETVVITKSGKGLRQGGPLSPLLLNLYLHHQLDTPWRSLHPDVPLIRVADDLLVICHSAQQASEVYPTLSQLVQDSGMTLKGSPQSTIRDLSTGQSVDWLGYRLTTNGYQLQVDITEKMWRSLAAKLDECHEKFDPPVRAVEVIRGWVAQLGPTYSTSDLSQVSARIREVAADHSFEETPGEGEIREMWERAHDRWVRRRQGVDAPTCLSRGSARAEKSRADSGSQPGVPSERGRTPGTSSSSCYDLFVTGYCLIAGGSGAWSYILMTPDGEVVLRNGDSPHTTQERMALIAVLRALEAIPPGSRVCVCVNDERVKVGIVAAATRGEGAKRELTPTPATPGRAVDLWRRLATKMTAYEVIVGNAHLPTANDTS